MEKGHYNKMNKQYIFGSEYAPSNNNNQLTHFNNTVHHNIDYGTETSRVGPVDGSLSIMTSGVDAVNRIGSLTSALIPTINEIAPACGTFSTTNSGVGPVSGIFISSNRGVGPVTTIGDSEHAIGTITRCKNSNTTYIRDYYIKRRSRASWNMERLQTTLDDMIKNLKNGEYTARRKIVVVEMGMGDMRVI